MDGGLWGIGIEEWSTPRGDGNQSRNIIPDCIKLRNGVPREGTETFSISTISSFSSIEEWSTPRGDGNCSSFAQKIFYTSIEEWSTPRGDGNFYL